MMANLLAFVIEQKTLVLHVSFQITANFEQL